MSRKNIAWPTGAALALSACLALPSANAAPVIIPLGSDYIETVQPTFFNPLGPLNPLAGLPIGPGTTDTIIQRQANCVIDLAVNGSNCSIPIEMVALSLVSTVDPLVRLRETPGSVVGTSRSGGMMTILSDGSGNGGTFDSFFDVFFDLSQDGGNTWIPQGFKQLEAFTTPWITVADALAILLDGSVVDFQIANSNNCPPGEICKEFHIKLTVVEIVPNEAQHTGRAARVPEPATLILVGLGLVALASRQRRLPTVAGA